MLPAARGTLHGQRVALKNVIRGFLCLEGITVPVRSARFTEEVLTRIAGLQGLQLIIRPLLEARSSVVRQVLILDREIILTVRQDAICRLLTTIPAGRAHGAILQSESLAGSYFCLYDLIGWDWGDETTDAGDDGI